MKNYGSKRKRKINSISPGLCLNPACRVREAEFSSLKEHEAKMFSEVVSWTMAAEMCAYDVAYFVNDDDEPIKFYLNMNDVFTPGINNEVSFDDIPEVYALWDKGGYDGLVNYVAKKNSISPYSVSEIEEKENEI